MKSKTTISVLGNLQHVAGNAADGLVGILRDRTVITFSVLFAIATAGLLWHQTRQSTRLVDLTAIQHAARYSDAVAEFRSLYTSEVVGTAKSHGLEITHDYKDKSDAIPLPATLSMMLGNRLAKKEGGGRTRLYSPYPFPWRSKTGGLRDNFSRQAWVAATRYPDKPFYRFQNENGHPTLRYAVADRMRASCVHCHNTHPDTPKNDWREGDVRGILEVSFPMEYATAQTEAALQESWWVIVGIGVLGFCCVTLVVRKQREESRRLEQRVIDRTRELQEQTEQLNAANRQLKMQQQALDEFLVVDEMDARGHITYVNGQFCKISQYSREELLGQDHRIVDSGYHRKSFMKEMWRTIRAGRVWRGEIKNRAKDGSFYWVDTTIVPFLDDGGQPEKYLAIRVEITKRKRAEVAREKLQGQLMESSRLAGMAEIATGVLHNVGNVLNSVNVATQLTIERVKEPHVINLAKAVVLMDEHTEDLAKFVTSHPQGRHFPNFLRELSGQLISDRDAVLEDLYSLSTHVDHIKEIVHLQQNHAKVGGVIAPIDLSDVVEDAIKMNDAALIRHQVELCHEFEPLPQLLTDRSKVLQILVNLISNAKHALSAADKKHKQMTIRIALSGDDHVKIEVEDNGVGISEGDLTKIFRHGFTTKEDGHGFGLHSSALGAKELGGTLTVHSDGPGQGALFTLVLPANVEEPNLVETAPCEV